MRSSWPGLTLLVAAGTIGLAACEGGSTVTATETMETMPTLDDVSSAQWEALTGRNIFFGHQSVGENLMEGVSDLIAENPQIRLTIAQSKDLSNDTPSFRHDLVGRNYFPQEKLREFSELSRNGFEGAGGIVMLKLCFEDVAPDTDADALFTQYQREINALRTARPDLTVVHFTMPLTVVENWKGRIVKTLLRRPMERDRNAVRNRYNELMRQAYEGREPLFDIAALESTLPSGARTFFPDGSKRVYVLAEEYTDDGGHLNATARKRIAEQFLVLLARLPA